MRVLHVGKFFPPHRGGMESHLELLSAHLRKSITVDVLVANDTDLTERSAIDGMAVTRAGTMLKFASTSFCPAMLRAVKKTNADVIHLHLPNPAAILVYLASGHTGPLVVTYHSDTERHKLLAAA